MTVRPTAIQAFHRRRAALVERLHYTVPQTLARLIRDHAGEAAAFGLVADIGCGTAVLAMAAARAALGRFKPRRDAARGALRREAEAEGGEIRQAQRSPPQALAVAPTRELASQVAADLERAGKRLDDQGIRDVVEYLKQQRVRMKEAA